MRALNGNWRTDQKAESPGHTGYNVRAKYISNYWTIHKFYSKVKLLCHMLSGKSDIETQTVKSSTLRSLLRPWQWEEGAFFCGHSSMCAAVLFREIINIL